MLLLFCCFADYTFFDRAFGNEPFGKAKSAPYLSNPGKKSDESSKRQIRTNTVAASRRVASVLQKIHVTQSIGKEQTVSDAETAEHSREYISGAIGLSDKASPPRCPLEGNTSPQSSFSKSHEPYCPESGLLKPKELAHHSPKAGISRPEEAHGSLNGTAPPRYNSSQLQEILYGGPDAPLHHPRAPPYHFDDPGGSLALGDKMATTRHMSLLERKKKQWEEERGEFLLQQKEFTLIFFWLCIPESGSVDEHLARTSRNPGDIIGKS